MRTHRSRSLAGAAAAGIMFLSLTACGEDASDSSATAANGSEDCAEPTGSTIKIATLVEESAALNAVQPSVRAGVEARVRAVNCDGGLGKAGHKLEVEFCQSNYDPNAVNTCAKDAAADETIVAAAGGSVASGTPGSIFAEAGMPNIPRGPYQDELDATTTFPIAPWGAQIAPGAPLLGCKMGWEKITLLLIQNPAAAGVADMNNSSLKTYGCPALHKVVNVPQETTDMVSHVVAASEGADAVVLAVSPSQAIAAVKAADQLGIDVPFIGNTGTMNADVIKATGGSADEMYLATQAYLPTDDPKVPGAAEFRADMEGLGQAALIDGSSQSAWIAVDLLANVAKDLDTVDRASVLEALSTSSGYDAGGQLPPIDFTKPAPNPAYPRLFNDHVAFAQIQDGQVVGFEDSDLPRFLPIEQLS